MNDLNRLFECFQFVITHFDVVSDDTRRRFISQLVALNSFISYRSNNENQSNK